MHNTAMIQSFVLLTICFTLLTFTDKKIATAKFITLSNKGNMYKKYKLTNNKITYIFLISLIIIFVILPILSLTFTTFNNGYNIFFNAFGILKSAIFNSLIYSTISATLIIFISFIIAYYSQKTKTNIHEKILLPAFIMPPIALGVSFITFYNQTWLNFIYSSFAILLISYIAKFLFISEKIIENTLKQIPESLYEIAIISGAGNLTIIRKIYLPLIKHALFVSFIIIFILTFSELAVSIMIYPPGTDLLTIKTFTYSANSTPALNSAMILIVFLISLSSISLFYILYSILTLKIGKK
jgi:ABC-type Fe3+ transport system permease subunit